MSDTELATRTKNKLKPPSQYKVVLLNDDYTAMDFVVAVLVQIFNKSIEESNAIMIHIHMTGRGVAGVYSLEIAKQKQDETHLAAKRYGYPLKSILEETIQ
ncbi:MAG: ATP-dependent Clp protease adaptor ClpS [Richelia sp. RM2_1_2]|nr:ATP-dependent Clp protease adaptor ClpS [Richelia sp. RM2_1_2]